MGEHPMPLVQEITEKWERDYEKAFAGGGSSALQDLSSPLHPTPQYLILLLYYNITILGVSNIRG